MPQEIKITAEQIRIAEKALLPEGKLFDEERVAFIENLDTLDLHAVPGSGKTTALLAKLIALEQHLPFEDRSGILVISHTNAAVDEIRKKIGHICPRLFGYPSFVGTIQSFVDNFLAIPYYKMAYKRSPIRIDDEIYYENHYPDYSLRSFLARRQDRKKILYEYRLINDQLSLGLSGSPFPFGPATATYQKIYKIKKKLREDGFLCFDDGYILAHEYLVNFPAVINIIRKRFKYVFVDEMQDMYKHQYDLIESIFGNVQEICFQRIGDKNQAIYNSDTEILDTWQTRNVKELNGSHRLHPATARIVQSLALSPINIIGHKQNPDGSAIDIQPIMLVYDDDSVHEVIPYFAGIIRVLINEGKIDTTTQHIHKAIAWTTSKPGEVARGIKLNNYHQSYSKNSSKLKINYPCIESYLHFYETGINKLASIRKSILNAILRVLRIEEINNPVSGRSFTKKSLADYIRQEKFLFYEEFKLKLYQTIALIAGGKTPEALDSLKGLARDVLTTLGGSVRNSVSFINTPHPDLVGPATATPEQKSNQYSKDGVTIEVTTVHSAKGQTHTSTLYMESFYQTNVGRKGQYESSRIADQLQGIALPDSAHEYIKQSMKMTYVGFSRPTHLLGFAVHRSRFDSLYDGKLNIDLWDVRTVEGPVENTTGQS